MSPRQRLFTLGAIAVIATTALDCAGEPKLCEADCTAGAGGGGSTIASSGGGAPSSTVVSAVTTTGSAPTTTTTTGPTTADLLAEPGWVAPAGVPPACEMRVAGPDVVLPKLSWAPCADGAAGCLDLVNDWAPGAEYVLHAVIPGAAHAEAHRLVVGRRFAAPNAHVTELLLWRDGETTAGMRLELYRPETGGSPQCVARTTLVEDDRALGSLLDLGESNDTAFDDTAQLYELSGGAGLKVLHGLTAEELHGNTVLETSLGNGFIALNYSPGNIVTLVPIPDGPAVEIA